jgi:hypothetical protein
MQSRRVGTLHRLALYLGAARYRELLADQRQRGRIVVTIEFARTPSAAQRAALALIAGRRCTFAGMTLSVASEELVGLARGVWTNHRFAAWLRGFVRHTLPRLDAVATITDLRVAIEGETRDYAALG